MEKNVDKDYKRINLEISKIQDYLLTYRLN